MRPILVSPVQNAVSSNGSLRSSVRTDSRTVASSPRTTPTATGSPIGTHRRGVRGAPAGAGPVAPAVRAGDRHVHRVRARLQRGRPVEPAGAVVAVLGRRGDAPRRRAGRGRLTALRATRIAIVVGSQCTHMSADKRRVLFRAPSRSVDHADSLAGVFGSDRHSHRGAAGVPPGRRPRRRDQLRTAQVAGRNRRRRELPRAEAPTRREPP